MTKTNFLPFIAFTSDEKDIATLKAFAAKHQWPEDCIHQGDIRTAAEYLKTNPSPALLLVEIPSAAEAPKLLDALAEVCDSDTKVITTGTVNEYSFYCWLMEIGIFSYLLKPLSDAMLEGALAKANNRVAGESGPVKQPGKLIAVTGTRGGVGATTLSINLAGAIADLYKKNVALVDIDPQEGSIALMLDLEPSRGLREALEKPDRIDPLFVDRVMSKHGKFLSVLSSEETLQEEISIHEDAADALLKELRDKFDVVVIDIPRYLNAFTRKCLAQSDHVILATELTLLCLRDMLRLSDLLRETIKIRPPLVVATRVGMSKQEMKIGDFEKGVNATIAHRIAFVPDVFMHISSDVPVVKFKSHTAVKPLHQLAAHLMPEVAGAAASGKESKGFSFFKSEKKTDAKETKGSS